jgi:hypothetical protein
MRRESDLVRVGGQGRKLSSHTVGGKHQVKFISVRFLLLHNCASSLSMAQWSHYTFDIPSFPSLQRKIAG